MHRVVAKCTGGRVIHSVGGDLAPLQLLCGVPRGCVVAAHACRRFLHHVPSDHVLVKLDFKNAFNSLSRACMIRAVQQFLPNILSLMYLALRSIKDWDSVHAHAKIFVRNYHVIITR